MPRPRRYAPSYEFVLYDSDITMGWRINGRISARDGERLEAAGRAVKVYEEISGKHVGWQKTVMPTHDKELPGGDPTPELMDEPEMDLVAGQAFARGHSRTMDMGMNDPRRLMRTHYGKLLPPEDEVERVLAKLHALTPRHLQAAAAD